MASIGYRSSGVRYDADGEIIGFDNAQGDTMDTEALNAFLKTGYNWDDQRIELTVNHFDVAGNNNWVGVPGDKAARIPATAEKGNVPGDALSNEVAMVNVNYSKQDLLGHSVRLQAFSQDFAATYGGAVRPTFQDPAYGPDVFEQSQNNSEKLGLKLTLVKDDLAGLPVSLAYGADLLNDKTYQLLVHTGRKWVPETDYRNIAPYAQAEFTGIQGLTLTAGVRYEDSKLNVDDFNTLHFYGAHHVEGGRPEFTDTLYNVGGTFQATDEWRVYANYSEGFSMPDVGRVLRGINLAGQDVESFLGLEPIITENTEFGAEYTGDTLSAQLSYYTSDSDFGQRLEPNMDGIYSVKREKTEVDGIEFRTQWFATEADVLGLRYAQTNAEYDSDKDGRVDADLGGANVAPDRANLSWERSWSDAVNSRVQVNRMLDRSFNNRLGATTAEFDGYTTVDLNLEVLAFGSAFNLGVQNLTNRNYFTYHAQTVGNDARNFAGIGRSFNLSYNLQF